MTKEGAEEEKDEGEACEEVKEKVPVAVEEKGVGVLLSNTLGEETHEEEDALNVDPFEYNGRTYYRDAEGNVYQEDEDENVDDTPIGRWLEAKQKIKFYPSST